MDAEFQQILIRVVKQADIKTAFKTEMNALAADKKLKFGQQLELIGTTMQSEDNAAGKCGNALDAKYKQYNDTPEKEKTFTAKMLEELDKIDCKFLSSLTRFALALSDEE